MSYISIDTEFSNTQNEFVNPVCVSVRTEEGVKTYWLDQLDEFKKSFDDYVEKGYNVLSFMSAAEYRFLLSIGYTREQLKKVKMVDLYPMWRIILFGIDEYNWGKYVTVENGYKQSVTTRKPKKGEQVDGVFYENKDGVEYKFEDIKTRRYNPSMAHACLKLLDVDIQTEHKELMRKIIISGDYENHKEDVMRYCESDTLYLRPLFNKLSRIIRKYDPSYNIDDVFNYGKWMLDVAVIENTGIHIDKQKIETFASNYGKLAVEIPEQCNKVHTFFKWDDRRKRFVKNYNMFEEFVNTSGVDWPKTEKGKYKSDKATLHGMENSYPEIRTLYNTINALREINYFAPNRINKVLNNIGSDGRWRGSLMPYGSLTSRNQPKPSEGYVFGMSRWLRNLVAGVVIGGDYSAQEIYFQGLVSEDDNFIESYLTGDPYTWFAKKTGVIPENVERKGGTFVIGNEAVSTDLQSKYSGSRALYKSMLLGMGYGMGVDALARRLTTAAIENLQPDERIKLLSGDKDILERIRIVGVEEAPSYPDEQRADYYMKIYKDTFPNYDNWKNDIFEIYKEEGHLKLDDGWLRIGRKAGKTSIVNFPIQGMGASILRRAVRYGLDEGLRIITTLHDAIYIESTDDNKERDIQTLKGCMLKAAPEGIRVDCQEMKIDWDNFKSDWSEGKGYEEFERFGKYFIE